MHKKELKDHQENKCSERIIKCEYCDASGKFTEINKHKNDINFCPLTNSFFKFLNHPKCLELIESKFNTKKRKISTLFFSNKKQKNSNMIPDLIETSDDVNQETRKHWTDDLTDYKDSNSEEDLTLDDLLTLKINYGLPTQKLQIRDFRISYPYYSESLFFKTKAYQRLFEFCNNKFVIKSFFKTFTKKSNSTRWCASLKCRNCNTKSKELSFFIFIEYKYQCKKCDKKYPSIKK
jgi:hypothetical protein